MLLRPSPPSRPRRARLLVPLAVVAVLTAACGSSDRGTAAPDPATSSAPATPPAASPAPAAAPSSAPAEEPAAEPVAITISGFAYDIPGPVPAGAELAVTNEDAEAHTFTVRDGGSVVVQGGATEMIAAPGTAGSYEIVCDFHGGMTATLVVT